MSPSELLAKWWGSTSGKILMCCAGLLVLAQVALLLDLKTLGAVLGLPVMAYFGLAMLGHLMTADDDMLGEWSNPEGSKRHWRRSLLELLLKALLFFSTLMWIGVQL